MSIRTKFEIETFVLGAHPTQSRKAMALMEELEEARATSHPDLSVLEEIYTEFSKENDVEALISDINNDEEQYWVERLAKLAAIDILTIGKVQPEHMNYMASLSDDAFVAAVKGATVFAKKLNAHVRDIEEELSADLVAD
jgi:diphthamide synthase (EF-2-diphthine--ammonia ligase)